MEKWRNWEQTLGCDEPVDLAENEGIGRLQKLDSSQSDGVEIGGVWLVVIAAAVAAARANFRWADFGGDEEGDVVAGIRLHDLAGVHRPIESVDFAGRMLYD